MIPRVNQSATNTGINNANAKRIHENRLHHFTEQENKSNRVIVYKEEEENRVTKRNVRNRVTNSCNRFQTNNKSIKIAVDVNKAIIADLSKETQTNETNHPSKEKIAFRLFLRYQIGLNEIPIATRNTIRTFICTLPINKPIFL